MPRMRFHAEHRFASTAVAVMRSMVDPELYLRLQLPDLSRPEVLDRESEGSRTRLQLRYAYVGRLDPIARRLVGNDQVRWLQDVEVDQAAMSGRLTFASEDRARRLHGDADIAFTSTDQETTRSIEGVLVVAVPIVGAMAERDIVAGLLHRLDLEAEAIRDALVAGG